LRFFFNSIVFNSIFLFKKFPKLKKRKVSGLALTLTLKKRLLLLNYILKKKKKFKGYSLKKNKGGFIITVLGFKSFMPKSHSKRFLENQAPLACIIGLKICQRRKRFSTFKKTTLNLISSSKPQHRTLQIKSGWHFKGTNIY
jgi:ribosomal protein S1